MPSKSPPRAESGPIINYEDKIGSQSQPDCFLCGAPGALLYSDLEDLLFHCDPGKWNVKQCPDPACRLAWLDPMPLAQDLAKAYRTYYTHDAAAARNGLIRTLKKVFDYARKGYLAWKFGYQEAATGPQKLAGLLLYLFPRYRLKAELSVMQLQARPGGRVLDIGCGHGWMTAFLGALGWEAMGIDFDPESVEAARSRGLEVRRGTLEAQLFPAEYFDAIVMSHVIEHIHDPLALFRECRRILKKDGILSMTTPNVASWGHKRFRQSWRGLEPPRHLYVYSRESLKTMTELAGFSVQTLTTVASLAPQIYQESQCLAAGGSETAPVASFWNKLGAQFFYWQEQFLLIFNSDKGEEIILKGINEGPSE
jgi:2-polyprenyl-3-methyl-5-hydroxy-6-metoxy-1,4-benzoquinol methylase